MALYHASGISLVGTAVRSLPLTTPDSRTLLLPALLAAVSGANPTDVNAAKTTQLMLMLLKLCQLLATVAVAA